MQTLDDDAIIKQCGISAELLRRFLPTCLVALASSIHHHFLRLHSSHSSNYQLIANRMRVIPHINFIHSFALFLHHPIYVVCIYLSVENFIWKNFFLLNAYMGSFERAQPALHYFERARKTEKNFIQLNCEQRFSSFWRNKFFSNSINEMAAGARNLCRISFT